MVDPADIVAAGFSSLYFVAALYNVARILNPRTEDLAFLPGSLLELLGNIWGDGNEDATQTCGESTHCDICYMPISGIFFKCPKCKTDCW